MNDENEKKQKIAELISAIKKAKEIADYELLQAYKRKYPESSLSIVAENESEYHKANDISKLQEALKSALKETAVPLEKIDFTKENFNKLFPRSRIETPIENVKLGAHQFEKLEAKERQNLLMAVHDTLKNPDLIINEQKENVFGEKENNHIYAKSFFINDKVHGIQSVVVSIDGENVSISTHERNINNIVNKIKKPDQLLFAAAKVRLLVEQHTKERLSQSVVNPIRENEYVASPQLNLQQKGDFVKQEENPSVKKSQGDSREKLNVATYKFQSNETLNEIIQSDSSFSAEAALLDNLIDCSIREVYEYASEKEQRVLRVFASFRNDYDTDMKNLAIQTDCAARWIAAKHWNPEKQEFQKEYVNRSAIESFPYELPWEMEEIEEEAFVNTQEKKLPTLKSQDEIIDNGIESVQSNSGMSEVAMEAEIAAQNNVSYESEEEYSDEIDTFFYDTNGNPHAPQKIIAVLENFQKIEPKEWNLSAEEKTAVFHLTQVAELGKNDFDNSLAKLKEYMNTEEFEKEEINYAKILTPILLTSLGQDFDEKTHAFSSEKFSYKFSTDQLKKEIPPERGSSLGESRKIEKAVSGENQETKKDNVSYQDFTAGKIIYGKTVLPPFASMTSSGHLKSCENFIVKGYDSENGTYFAENGDERLAIPRETFNSLLNPAGLHKNQQEEKIFRMEGNGIVFDNPEKGVKGTVVPEFSLMTQNGLLTYKDCVVSGFNETDRTYTLRNNDSIISVTEERFKEITSPERFANEFDENTPAYKKLLKTQYDDFFKERANTAYNFRHNLSVFCRKEANSPCDALKVAKGIIQKMSPEEQDRTKNLLNKIAREGESLNQLIVRTYHEAVKEVPLNEEYIKHYQPENRIARPFYDTVSADGQKIDSDPQLLRTDKDYNLKIGDTLKDINIKSDRIFGHGKENVHFSELKVISASKEGNTVTLMDREKSFIEIPRDTVLKAYKEQQLKELKHKQSHSRRNSMELSYS